MGGGEIKNNKAADNTTVTTGGGVFVNDGGSFIMHDGTMSGNVANYGGGIYVYGMGVLKKSSFGGIIYGSNDSVNGNVAANGDGFGHVAYVYTGEIETSDTTDAVRRIRIDEYIARDADDEDGGMTGDNNNNASPDNIKYRDITADINVALDTDKAASSGGWQ
jgi:hypothetical protein